jgi:hypothetical protein
MSEYASAIEESKAKIARLKRNEAGERIAATIAAFQKKKAMERGEDLETPEERYRRLKSMLIIHPTSRGGRTLYSAPIGPGIDNSKTLVLIGSNTPAKKILAEVSDMTGVPQRDIISPLKDNKTVQARFLLMYRLATQKKWRQPEIARFVNRDHSSVIYGVRAYCKRFNLPMPRGWNAGREDNSGTGS